MRLTDIQRSRLYEGLDFDNENSMLLWESAGLKLRESALTADQIQKIFQSVEQSATAAGGNRTLVGKGKDAAQAVNKAWEDLKSKMQNSGPVKGFDQKVSDALSKIGMGAAEPEFEGKVNKWVQKYRDFAKKHPVAQGAIYATLIALAGITGAGVGGAAALGLLKMADKLLQGERFSSAAYSGVKAGAMAFAASKLGDYIKGLRQGDQVPPAGTGELPPGAPKMDFDKYDYYVGDSNNVVAVPKGSPNPFTGDASADWSAAADKADRAAAAVGPGHTNPDGSASAAMRRYMDADAAQQAAYNKIPAGGSSSSSISGNLSGITGDQMVNHPAYKAAYADQIAKFGSDPRSRQAAAAVARAAAKKAILRGESQEFAVKKLSEGQVYLVFNRIATREQLTEGPMDMVRGALNKGREKLQTIGKNITTKVTADKLNSAWRKAGSPTDSAELAKFLQAQGVDAKVVDQVYADLKIASASAGGVDIEQVRAMIAKLPTDRKVRLINYMTKQLKVA